MMGAQTMRCFIPSRGLIAATALWLAILVPVDFGHAQSGVQGNCRLEIVKDRPGAYISLYEWNIFFSPDGNGGNGQSFRVGYLPNLPRGYYTFSSPAVRASLFLDQPLFYGRPVVVENVVLPAAGSVVQNVTMPSDYLCAFGGEPVDWGDSPWTPFGAVWYQTFQATGTSITGISFKAAGTNATQIDISILAEASGNITTWPRVGPVRRVHVQGANFEVPVRYRSGEIPTVPLKRYALKLAGVVGSPDASFSVYRRIKDGYGYAKGTAHDAAGVSRNYDLYAMIFSDSDHTLVPYCSRKLEQGELAGWAGRWCQEISAVGIGLAGAEIYFAGDPTWDIPLLFKVRSGGPNGPQVGAAKYGRGAFQAATAGFAAASWNRGEVSLTPGQKYYLEVSSPNGYNPVRFVDSENTYSLGAAYQSGELRATVDLLMQVVEYAEVIPPTLGLEPMSLAPAAPAHTNPADDVVAVRNLGGGILRYTVTDSADWLTVAPAVGEVADATDTLKVMYDASRLPLGTYSATITVTAPGVANSPQIITVHLTITPPLHARADFDRDGDVDQEDFGKLQRCLSGAGVTLTQPSCQDALLDGDDDVDQDDITVLQRCMGGAAMLVDPLCAD